MVAVVAVELYDGCFRLRACSPSELHAELEWVADRLASGPADAFERLWLLSVIGIATGAQQVRFVAPPPDPDSRLPIRHGMARLAQERFPGEPRFQLAGVVARRAARVVARGPEKRLDLIAGLSVASERSARAYFRDTVAELERLSDDDVVGSEARLRSGMICVLLGDPTRALELALGASSSSDPWVRFLALQLAGRIHSQLGNLERAVNLQKLSNAEHPGMRSGVTALVAALFAAGRHDEAYEAAERLNWLAWEEDDPWIQYGWGDYRHWLPAYRHQLRAMVQR
jgi:hypothetical protein